MGKAFIKREQWQKQIIETVTQAVKTAGSRRALARQLGTQYQSVLSWLRGGIPSDKNMEKLEDYLKHAEVKK